MLKVVGKTPTERQVKAWIEEAGVIVERLVGLTNEIMANTDIHSPAYREAYEIQPKCSESGLTLFQRFMSGLYVELDKAQWGRNHATTKQAD